MESDALQAVRMVVMRVSKPFLRAIVRALTPTPTNAPTRKLPPATMDDVQGCLEEKLM